MCEIENTRMVLDKARRLAEMPAEGNSPEKMKISMAVFLSLFFCLFVFCKIKEIFLKFQECTIAIHHYH